MRGSEIVFVGVNGLHYDFNKIKSNDQKCFQYALTVALIYEQIKSHPERILKIKPFIDHYNWKDIDFPSHSKDWEK